MSGVSSGGSSVTPRSLLAEQPIDRPGGHFGEELPVRIGPLIGGAAGDEHRTRRAQRDQHVRVHRHLVPAAHPFLEIAREPPREVLRHVVDRFAPVAARERSPHLARSSSENTAAMRSSIADAQSAVLPRRECPCTAICFALTDLSVSK